MKRIILTVLTLFFSQQIFSQTKMIITKTTGTDSVWLSDIKSITFKTYSSSQSNRGIVFISNRDGNSEIYKINSDGTGLTRLTNSIGDKNFPRWSPDGTKISYADFSTTPGEIYIMNPDGSGKTKITSNSTWGHDNINWPFWKNNNEIIYSGTGGTAHWALWKVNITTFVHTQIYSETGVVKWATDINPISGKIFGYAIIDYAHGTDDWLFSCDTNGTNFVRIVNNLGYNNSPTWPRINQALTKIVYPWDDRTNPNPLWIANLDGSSPVKIANTGGTYHDQMCAFSPDGSKIVMGTQPGRTGQFRLWTINVDGSSRTQLTTGSGSYDDTWPDWK
jgi:TolB protein